MSNYISYKHSFLVAMPSMQDLNFTQAVVLLQEHNHEGALGIIINKPLHIKLHKVFDHLDIELLDDTIGSQPVYMGGPVAQEQGFVIHDPTNDDDQLIGYELSANKEQLSAIANHKGPKNYIVTLGYAGWKAGQLEQEIANNDWLTVPFNREIIFETPIQQRWQQSAHLLGIDIIHLPIDSGHA